MIRKLLLLFFTVFTVSGLFAQSGTIKGKVFDGDTGEPMPFANVSVVKDGKIITGGMTDFDGKYTIKPVPVGKFSVKASSMGYKTIVFNNLQVNNSKITFQDFKLPSSVSKIDEVVIKEYKVPLISKDQNESGGTVTQEDIDKMPGRSATAVASTVGGVSNDGSGGLSIRGARSEGTVYYIDGVKVMSNTLPKSAIEQVNVITGGLSAKYGDATGGIINVTTKGAAKELHGGVELATSQYLDPYGSSLLAATVTGPLFSKKTVDPYDSTKIKKTPVVGFFLTGRVSYNKDASPNIRGVWVAKDGVREDILARPYVVSEIEGASALTYLTDYYGSDKFEHLETNPNNSSLGASVNGKLNINLAKNIFLAVGGRYSFYDRTSLGLGNTLFNSEHNGHYRSNSWQVNARLTHKLANKTEEEEKKSASVLKNVYYELIGSYEKGADKTYDEEFKDDIFKYGHVGRFVVHRAPSYSFTTQKEGYAHGVYEMNGFADTAVTFTPSEYNPELAAYTSHYYTLYDKGSIYYRNMNLIESAGGVLNGQTPKSVYGMFAAPGTPFGSYNYSDRSQFIVSGNGSADVGDHEFQIGFEYEQRDQRYYSSSTIGLWYFADQLANSHLTNLDLDDPILHTVTEEDGSVYFTDTIGYHRLYSEADQKMFDYKFREYLASKGEMIEGEAVTVNGTQWVDVSSYDPSDLSIDYFSADELINEGRSYVSYFGYDVYGNKLTSNPTLEDFFTETEKLSNGKEYHTRPVGAFRPNYLAFYIQDKFSFDDIIFQIGLRADRYDANQKVLKDAYSLHNTFTVSDMRSIKPSLVENMPNNIGDDYIVYANNINYQEATSVLGYRTGDNPADIKWYNAQGTQIDDPQEIAPKTGIAPLLQNPTSVGTGGEVIKQPELSAKSFTDYVPQWNLMPRIAFSFPISDVALFKAHYDVMTKRPFGVNRLNPITYLHLLTFAGGAINNPNLMPEKTIEYELGFQQKVSNTSSLKIAAFYREMRDQAQVQNITGAYPVDYITYQNIDFGTVKGLTLEYDLRRTGNVRATVNYTLQFANGTGSNAATALSLIKQGEPNIRQTLPLDIDQRHSVKVNLDYAYASGKAYNGPVLFGTDILQNTGVTFVASFTTGSPYSKKDPRTNYLLGSMNGSRMPSTFRTDMKLYRNFQLTKPEKGKMPIGMQVYLDVFNLFNTFNVRSVFGTTGNADDDAYLTTAKNQAAINAQIDPDSYRNYYRMRLSMLGMYMAPRTIRLGLTLSF